ncbi:MAG: glycosyltransferase [Dysgonamonadaceae bacterium]|jgi:glycosyltransferase involved in cell wall biosynthesis|nr:glycosyltransferase [Dysgonamonadaceae bacterium]
MKILIVSTSDVQGGAAIAAYRLMQALNASGTEAKMMVCRKKTRNKRVIGIGTKWATAQNFYSERWRIFRQNGFSRRHLFDVSIANTGHSITDTPEFREADLIHLHWINQGMLSLTEIETILKSGKKVVWTLHDMWPITGICHHTLVHTDHPSTFCACPYFGKRLDRLSHLVFNQKQAVYSSGNISFVACSQWLEKLAKNSPLTQGQTVASIPNPIDTQQYCPENKDEIRKKLNLSKDKKYILYAAAKASDKRKGLDYLLAADKILSKMKKDLVFLIAGVEGEMVSSALVSNSIHLGYVSFDKMTDYYRAADIFLTPSLFENLPNTIMEAMACGTPCVGFNVGGIPEMIDHKKNGFVCHYQDADALAKGIIWTLFEADYRILSINAREKALRDYSETVVAKQYTSLYKN